MTSTAFGQLPHRSSEPMDSFEVRRRGWLYVTVVVVPLILAAGYAWLAYDRSEVALAAVAGALVLLGLAFIPALRDLRSPLLVADEHGVRLQGSHGWVGLLWSEIETIAVRPQRGVRGPRLDFVADQTPLPYTVPLGLATDCSAGQAEVELAQRRDAGRH